MEYTYDDVTHQVGREHVDKDGNGEDKIVETMYSHALATKLVIRVDKEGTYFTVVNVHNNKMLGSCHTKQFTIDNLWGE
jgi:hypothetical protein